MKTEEELRAFRERVEALQDRYKAMMENFEGKRVSSRQIQVLQKCAASYSALLGMTPMMYWILEDATEAPEGHLLPDGFVDKAEEFIGVAYQCLLAPL